MEIVITRIIQIIVGAIIVEHLLEGLHRNYWTVKIRERILLFIRTNTGEGGVLYEYLLCKFCESWAVGWAVAIATILWCGTWSWDWIWMGVVMSSGANMVHGFKGWINVAKFSPFGGKTVIAKKED